MRSTLLILSILISGCATTSGRFAIGAAIGGGVGAAGGAALSPNDESRGLNALLFGLGGALLGGGFGILTDQNAPSTADKTTLKEKEIGANSSDREFRIDPHQPLPQFVKDRLRSVVIEEYQEPDNVAEDGSLHEPHKVYRIKRPAELISKPATEGKKSHGE